MERKRFLPLTGIGTVSLLMIGIVLCMVLVSVLALTSASRDYRYSQTLSEHTTAYFSASNEATEKLWSLDGLIRNTAQTNPADFCQAITAALSGLEVDAQSTEDGLLLSYSTPIGDTQALSVVLRVYPPSSPDYSDTNPYDIITWQEIGTTQWQGDNHLTLLDES